MAHLFEAHINVINLDRSIAFYRDVVGLGLAHVSKERRAAFLWIGRPGLSMLGLWSAGASPNTMQLHVAICLELEAVLTSCAALQSAGIQPLDFHGNPATEPSVIGWMPAASVFFKDPDGNLLEYLAILPDQPQPEAGVVRYSEWLVTRSSMENAKSDAPGGHTAARAIQISPSAPGASKREGGFESRIKTITPTTSPKDCSSRTMHIESYHADRGALLPLFALADDSEAQISTYISLGEVIVARDDDVIIGHLQILETDDAGVFELKSMAVTETRQGEGIGRGLVEAAVVRCRNRNGRRLIVSTATADIHNLRFYQRQGFRMYRVVQDAFGPSTGYAEGALVDGIPLRDQVFLRLDLEL